jgi:hypothetical protein
MTSLAELRRSRRNTSYLAKGAKTQRYDFSRGVEEIAEIYFISRKGRKDAKEYFPPSPIFNYSLLAWWIGRAGGSEHGRMRVPVECGLSVKHGNGDEREALRAETFDKEVTKRNEVRRRGGRRCTRFPSSSGRIIPPGNDRTQVFVDVLLIELKLRFSEK